MGSSASRISGSRGEGHGERDPLLHAAGELVRVGPQPPGRVRDAQVGQQPGGRRPGRAPGDAAVAHRLGQLRPDAHQRVEGAHRVLEDHRDLAAADRPQAPLARGGQGLAADADLPADLDLPVEPEDGPGEHRLARAGLTDQREPLAAPEPQADVLDQPDRRAARAPKDQAHAERSVRRRWGAGRGLRGAGGWYLGVVHGHRASPEARRSWTMSASSAKATATMAMAMPGNGGHPPGGGDVVGALAHHGAPFRARRLRPDPDERQAADDQDGAADVSAPLDDQGVERVGQDVPQQQPPAAHPQHPGAGDVRHREGLPDLAAQHARGDRPGGDRSAR